MAWGFKVPVLPLLWLRSLRWLGLDCWPGKKKSWYLSTSREVSGGLPCSAFLSLNMHEATVCPRVTIMDETALRRMNTTLC